MKILLCNIPIREAPDQFPPVACTSLCNALDRAGYETIFYDIDAQRPAKNELRRYFKENQFDIVGISAVVSTAYKYTKELAGIIRAAAPKTGIILGGNLGAAYEVLLNKCDIDLCVIGEGERAVVDLVRHWEKYNNFLPNSDLYKILGLAFLGADKKAAFTGFRPLIGPEEIEQPDYRLLEKFSLIDHYITDPLSRYDFRCDKRSYEATRADKKMATIFTTKGCINKCSFCHRWIKGYRIIPVQKVINAIKFLAERYDVGFFCISDECFGEHKEWLDGFIRMIKPLDVLFQIGAARVSIVKRDPDVIRRLKDVGLTAIYFGMESGSDKILKAMDKNTTRQENLRAAQICAQAGVYTIIQLVLGMPGENDQTINETIDFVNLATGDLPSIPELSINYLQVLPGTPCYDLLRDRGYVGATLEGEEEYLLKVSDINASEFKQYINVSEEPLAKVKLWKMKVGLSARIHWLKKHSWKFPKGATQPGGTPTEYFLKYNPLIYRIIDLMGNIFWSAMLFINRISIYGIGKTFLVMVGLIREDDRPTYKIGYSRT